MTTTELVVIPDEALAVATPAERSLYHRYLQEQKAKLAPDPSSIPYFYDPAGWIREMFDWSKVSGGGPTPYQNEILSAIPEHQRVSVRGPHGLGKTGLASWTVLWFAQTRDGLDWKVLTTASAWRQLTVYLWPEIHKWARLLRWDKLGRQPYAVASELLKRSLVLKTGQASAVASDDPAAIEGAHADHLLYLLDEAKTIIDGTVDAIEGAFSGAGEDTVAEAYALMISTPGEPNGRFYDIQSRKPGTEDWWTRHVTLAEAIAAKRISAHWAEQRKLQWGETSALYQNRVLGNFATADESAVIPLSWVEMAVQRGLERVEAGTALPAFTCLGCDVADSGSDRTVIAPRFHNVIPEIRVSPLEDTMSTAGRVAGVLNANHGTGYAAVDGIGIGAGVVSRLREQGHDVFSFIASARSEQIDLSGELGFANMRAAAWWTMRELLDPINKFNICLPDDDMLVGDLTAPRWRVQSGGKILVEPKDDIRKRLGRSTDHGDAVVHAFALRPETEVTTTITYDAPVSISPF